MPLDRHEFTTSWFPGHRNAPTKSSIGAIVEIVHLLRRQVGRPLPSNFHSEMGCPAINNISFNNDRSIIILTLLNSIRQDLSDGAIIRVVLQKYKNDLWFP